MSGAIIAHRMATVTAADNIAVLDTGTLAATGTHDEPIATSPLYRELAATQLTTEATVGLRSGEVARYRPSS